MIQRLAALEQDGADAARITALEGRLATLPAIGSLSLLEAALPRLAALELAAEQTLRRGGPAEVEKLVLRDKNGVARIGLGLFEDGSPGLMLTDANRKGGVALSLAEDGSSAISFYDAEGRTRARLSMHPDGPALSFYNPDGKLILKLPQRGRQPGVLEMITQQRQQRPDSPLTE
ncbi:MAG TPA: hypothetical protein VE911_03765 [Candidatus Nitrosopolaris sp.]|nr:hypothetical protein [Candidatus Nitrosopolaris sp.]